MVISVHCCLASSATCTGSWERKRNVMLHGSSCGWIFSAWCPLGKCTLFSFTVLWVPHSTTDLFQMQHPGCEGTSQEKSRCKHLQSHTNQYIWGGFFVMTLDPYSAAAEGGALCACEVVQSGKLCHGTDFCEQLLLWYLLLILLASWVSSYFLREYLVFWHKADIFF